MGSLSINQPSEEQMSTDEINRLRLKNSMDIYKFAMAGWEKLYAEILKNMEKDGVA